MSTATAEPPATEVKLPPAGDIPTPAQKDAFLNLFRGKKAAPKEAIIEDKVVTEAPAGTPPPVVEKKAETPPPVVEKKEEPKSDADKNFAALRQKAEAKEKEAAEAAAERDRLKAEMEELRKRPAPEEFVKELELTKKERAEYQKRLREADLARDPEFNAKYDTGIQTAMQQMVDIVAATGVDRKEASAAVSAWNKGQFADWMEGLGPVEKLEFGAAMQQVMSLYGQKQTELSQAEQTWQGLQKQREESAKQEREKYLGNLNSEIEANLKELAETPLGKDHTDLLAETRTLLRRAGGLEGERIDNKSLLGMVGKSLLLAKGFERQEKALAEKAEKIAELEKTLAERDEFIKKVNGATPGIGGKLPPAQQDRKALARAMLNPVVR